MIVLGFGILSLIAGILSLIIGILVFLMLSMLPLSPQIYKQILFAMIVPFLITMSGIVFYFLQKKIVVTKMAVTGIVLNIITLLIEVYLVLALLPLI